MEEFLARKSVSQWKSLTDFYRFSKQCQPFSQNGTERKSKNYGTRLPFYSCSMERNLKLYSVSYCITPRP